MQNYREAGQTLADLFKNVKAKLGLGAGLELVCAMAGADGDGQRVAAGAGDELFDFFGMGVGAVLSGDLDLVLNAGESAKLGLNDNAVVMCVLDDLAGDGDVVLKGLGGSVDHDGSEAAVNAGLAQLEGIAMVKVKSDGQTGLNDGGLDQLHQIGVICICTGALGYLKYQRSVEILRGFGDALHDLHIIYVESANSVSAIVSFFKHFFCSYQRHS